MHLKKNLSKGILVDDEDLRFIKFNRAYTDNGYVRIHIDSKRVYLHKLILGHDGPVDHINRNKLDCRKENLRPATAYNNAANKGISANNTSGYKGVSPRSNGTWQAEIMCNRTSTYLGSFGTKEEAALAYNKAALLFHKEFAYINNLVN